MMMVLFNKYLNIEELLNVKKSALAFLASLKSVYWILFSYVQYPIHTLSYIHKNDVIKTIFERLPILKMKGRTNYYPSHSI